MPIVPQPAPISYTFFPPPVLMLPAPPERLLLPAPPVRLLLPAPKPPVIEISQPDDYLDFDDLLAEIGPIRTKDEMDAELAAHLDVSVDEFRDLLDYWHNARLSRTPQRLSGRLP